MIPTDKRGAPELTAHQQAGFSLLEILIGITVLLVGVAGLLSMQTATLRNSSYARHSNEAAMLAQDKLELLRTVDPSLLPPPPEFVDEQGLPIEPDSGFRYTRTWTALDNGAAIELTVTVSWQENGSTADEDTYRVELQTVKSK